jgi:hypothetical protein
VGRSEFLAADLRGKLLESRTNISNIDVLWNESSLSNTSAKMSPTHVQFSMLRTAANDEDLDLRLKRSPKEISILF